MHAEVMEKNKQYQLQYARNLRANPTPEYRATQNRNNKKQAPATKARQQAAVANKTYYCQICDVPCRDAASLVRHNKSGRHLTTVRRGGKGAWHCHGCKKSFPYESGLKNHQKSKSHKTLHGIPH